MSEDQRRGFKIFLQYSFGVALLAGFNFYMYFTGGDKLFLVVAITCAAALVGWIGFYAFYVRRGE
ncbi:MAG TPA: hypothetical protein VJH03_21335 [Blastocatellia bacterium]|nr:hypothetical protein [Blastocatellia bacterium]